MKLTGLKNFIVSSPTMEAILFRAVNLPVVNVLYKAAYARRIRGVLNTQEKIITIEPYNLCNLRCVMCPYSKMTRPKEMMDMGLFKKIVAEAAGLGFTTVTLQMYSEPLLDPHLIERIKLVKTMGMKVGFFTNATLLDEKMADALLDSGLDWIKFSVDAGSKEDYDKIRIGGDWERVKKNIISFYEKRKSRGMAAPKITVFMIKQPSNERNISAHKTFWSEWSDDVNISVVDNRAEGEKPDMRGTAYPCFEPNHPTVLSNGKLVLCCLDYDGKMILGDLKKHTLEEVMKSDEYKRVTELHMSFRGDEIGLCKKCTRLYKNAALYWWVA
ncbi:MAG: radical SAM protein [Candidatus Aenigmarchaeota archaeon]|nr:radical SAM protein [Candidatus Aenigmarchaeota archaeon]